LLVHNRLSHVEWLFGPKLTKLCGQFYLLHFLPILVVLLVKQFE
jgi:hypothetical protein